MRVICIDDRFELAFGSDRGCPIVFGETYTVVEAFRLEGVDYYSFEEVWDNYFDQRAFAPVSTIDETEMIRENQNICV